MSTGIYRKGQHFDNLSYLSDGRDRISYINTSYPISSSDTAIDSHGIVLQPSRLGKSKRDTNLIYAFQPSQENVYAYNNAAFSDVSGVDSRGPSIRSQQSNLYQFQKKDHNRSRFSICTKYWYIFVTLAIIILVAIGLIIGFAIVHSKNRTNDCHLICGPSETLLQINSTHCECQFVNECQFETQVCKQFPCIKFNGTGYECNCTSGYQHPPLTNNLQICQDIDECQNSSACGEHQICNNTMGSYNCYCQPGYDTIHLNDRILCQDKNECNNENICSNGYCINTNGSFYCECKPGFVLDHFNPYYCEDIDECSSTHNCSRHNEMCVNIHGSFLCTCASGYRRDTNGNCLNINECTESNTICDINSRCEDRNGSFSCCIKRLTDQCFECGYDYRRSRSSVHSGGRRTRMINGQSVEAGDFPWVATLLIKKEYYDSEPRYVCSGSLVSSWNILTAAHCLDEQHFRKQWELSREPSSFKDIFDIRIGVHNLSVNSTDLINSQSYSIANFTLHSEYISLSSNDATVKNDIAIIKLIQRIQRTSTTDWICLPTSVNVQNQDILKVVSYNHLDDQSIQQQLDVRVLDNQQSSSQCRLHLHDIAEDAFCAISINESSVLGVGDSGAGAMLFNKNDHWELAGIMSKTGIDKAYSAMTNLSMHIDWISSLLVR